MRKSAIVASLCDIKCNHTFQNLILFAFLRILWKKFDSFAILLFLVSSVLSLYSLFAVADKYFIVQRKSNLRAAFSLFYSVYISLPASRNVLFVLVICFLRGAFFVVNMTILFKYILMKWWIIRYAYRGKRQRKNEDVSFDIPQSPPNWTCVKAMSTSI